MCLPRTEISLSRRAPVQRQRGEARHPGTGEEVRHHFAWLCERLYEGLDRADRHLRQVGVAVVDRIGARNRDRFGEQYRFRLHGRAISPRDRNAKSVDPESTWTPSLLFHTLGCKAVSHRYPARDPGFQPEDACEPLPASRRRSWPTAPPACTGPISAPSNAHGATSRSRISFHIAEALGTTPAVLLATHPERPSLMGFKADTSFLRFLSMGAAGVHRTMDRLRDRGFEPIELERYCGSNKIWTTKVKRLRLPDLLCVKTGMRAEVRAKTDLKIRMSDAPANPDRVWDAGLRDDDIVALITCFDTDDGPEPADDAVCFTVGALRASMDRSRLGPPKSASEGAERDRTWPATVPSRDGTVLAVSDERLIVEMNADGGRPARRQTYTLRGKSVYVSPGDTFRAQTTILAGEPPALADLSSYLPRRYAPLDELRADADVDRYAAVKAMRFRDDPRDQVIPALEDLIRREAEERVALEAAGSAAALGSELGQERITRFIRDDDGRPELRMEAVFI